MQYYTSCKIDIVMLQFVAVNAGCIPGSHALSPVTCHYQSRQRIIEKQTNHDSLVYMYIHSKTANIYLYRQYIFLNTGITEHCFN